MKIKDLTKIAICIALTIVLGLFPGIPVSFLSAPIILQNMGIILMGMLLTPKQAFASSMIFLLMVAVGMPMLSGGRGGFVHIIGPTGGYLFSWPLNALLSASFISKFKGRYGARIVGPVLGSALTLVVGAVYLALYNHVNIVSMLLGQWIFLPGDIVKVIICYAIWKSLATLEKSK